MRPVKTDRPKIRDAVALWWYNRTPLPGVDVLSLEDPWLVELLGQYASIGRELWLLDLNAQGKPIRRFQFEP